MRAAQSFARNATAASGAAEFLGAVDEEGDVVLHLENPPSPFS